MALFVTAVLVYWCVWASLALGIKDGQCVAVKVDLDMTFLLYGIVLFSFLPFLLVCVWNILIIVKLIRHRSQAPSATVNQSATHHRTTAMLLAVVVTFMVLYIPAPVLYIVSIQLEEDFYNITQLELYIVSQIVLLCPVVNSSVNFFLYIIWGRTFRTRFLSMIKPKACM